MMSLELLLSQRSVRDLYAIARVHELPFNNRRPRTEIVARLCQQLRAQQYWRSAYRRSSAECREALRLLHAAGYQLPEGAFFARFGCIRPYRPWAEPLQPWKHPVSVTEALWYGGFIGRDKNYITLCAEVAAILPPLPRIISVDSKERSSLDLTNANSLLFDLAAFLGTLLARPGKVTHGRWLGISTLSLINSRLRSPDPQIASARSELQTGRLRFLHYLAEAAGLIAVTARTLMPTPAAWAWLEQSAAQQRSQLYAAIRHDLENRDRLWDRYRLPSITLVQWDALLTQLAELAADTTYSLRQFSLRCRLSTPIQPLTSLVRLMDGPLHWLGIARLVRDGRWFCRLPNQQTELLDSLARLQEMPESFVLHLNGLPPLKPLVELSAWADIQPSSIQITADTVKRSHLSRHEIARQIANLANRPLSRAGLEQLKRWLHEQPLQIETMTVLTSADPTQLNQLFGSREIRQHLGNRLNAHQGVIQSSELNALTRKLVRRRLIEPPAIQLTAAPSLDDDGTAYAYLAMRIYQELGDTISLPVPLPGAISDTYKAAISTEQIAQLEHIVTTTKDRLHSAMQRAMHDYAGGEVTVVKQEQEAEAIQSAIERAFQLRGRLTIDYFSPYQGQVTRREIEPLVEIRWQGDSGYVEAWCSLDNAPRTFRLDRILRIIDPS